MRPGPEVGPDHGRHSSRFRSRGAIRMKNIGPGPGAERTDVDGARRNTRPLRVAELASQFPGFQIDARRVTLIPPLARALAGRSWMLCELLEAIPLLRTHELVLLGKP